MPDETPKSPDLKLDLVKEIKIPTAVLAADLAKEDRALAACFDGGIYEVNLESGDFAEVGRHSSYASGVRYLRNSDTAISGGYDGTLQWHNFPERKTYMRIKAHQFWSWQLDVSSNEKLVASVTGQYLPGGYKYEPAAEREPSVKVYEVDTGELRWSFSHIPPVLSVAFSPDNKFLAAANIMGEIRIWNLESGKQTATITTPDFTSWGIIKSHHYIGGVYALSFSPDANDLLAAGMGPMNDPMAGNGKQTWQRFVWRDARKTSQIKDGENGNGLMETIEFHPSGKWFLMAGRMAQGKWNTALFDSTSGSLVHSIDNKMRVTDSAFTSDGTELLLAGATSQEKKKDGKCPDFGRLKRYKIVST